VNTLRLAGPSLVDYGDSDDPTGTSQLWLAARLRQEDVDRLRGRREYGAAEREPGAWISSRRNCALHASSSFSAARVAAVGALSRCQHRRGDRGSYCEQRLMKGERHDGKH
jgi:hypothetical protein